MGKKRRSKSNIQQTHTPLKLKDATAKMNTTHTQKKTTIEGGIEMNVSTKRMLNSNNETEMQVLWVRC